MPFLMEDEEKQAEQQSGQNISGQSSVINQQSQSAQPQKSSGSYTNLQKYLDANKEQATQMGAQVVGGVEQSAQQAQSDINKFQSNVKPQVQAETAETAQARLKNPTMSAADYQKIQQTGGYEGPTNVSGVEGYEQANKATQQAAEKLKGISTEAGRTNLVVQQFAKPSYTQGQKKLDTMLVSKNPESRAQLENVGNKWGGIESLLNEAVNKAGSQIQSNVATALKNKELISNIENKTREDFLNQLQNTATSENQRRAKQLQDYEALVNENRVSDEMASSLGVAPGSYSYGLQLPSYFTPDRSQVNASQVASQEQKDYWKALNQMLGQDDTAIDYNAQMPQSNFLNKDKFQQDYNTRANEVKNFAQNTLIVPKGSLGSAIGNMQDFISSVSPDQLTNPDVINSYVDKKLIEQGYDPSSPGFADWRNEAQSRIQNFANQYGLTNLLGSSANVSGDSKTIKSGV